MSIYLKPMPAGVGSTLLACVAGGLIALTGCSSGSASSSAGSSAASAAASSPAAASPSSTAPSSTAPSWATALGPGVTVVPPGTTTAPGHGSPGAVLAGYFTALKDKSVTEYCGYTEPDFQAQCKSVLSKSPASQFPSSVKNLAPGYVVIDGDKAVAGATGTVCAGGQTGCVTNNDPAAVFTTVHTFAALWKNAVTPSGTSYSLEPLTKINGNWYITSSSA